MPKKGENIYKRKDKRWEARYIKSYNPDGKANYGYCYAKTYLEAKQKSAEAKAKLLNGGIPQNEQNRRFFYYCDEWLTLKRTCIKESSYAKYHTTVENHIKPGLGGYFVQSLNSVIIEQFGYEMLYNKGLSAKSVKDILVTLNSILLYTAKRVPKGLQNVEVVYPKENKKNMRILTKEEQENFIRYLIKDLDNYKFGVLLALLTGMRIGEVCALKWENISIKEGTVKVSSTMQRVHDFNNTSGTKTKVMITEPKSEKSVRIIPLTHYALELCKIKKIDNNNAFVLTGKENKYVEPRTMQYHIAKYTNDCGLEGVHFHTMRHTFATRCVEVDFEIKSLSEILGHASPRITLERYVHSSLELKKDNIKKLSAIGF